MAKRDKDILSEDALISALGIGTPAPKKGRELEGDDLLDIFAPDPKRSQRKVATSRLSQEREAQLKEKSIRSRQWKEELERKQEATAAAKAEGRQDDSYEEDSISLSKEIITVKAKPVIVDEDKSRKASEGTVQAQGGRGVADKRPEPAGTEKDAGARASSGAAAGSTAAAASTAAQASGRAEQRISNTWTSAYGDMPGSAQPGRGAGDVRAQGRSDKRPDVHAGRQPRQRDAQPAAQQTSQVPRQGMGATYEPPTQASPDAHRVRYQDAPWGAQPKGPDGGVRTQEGRNEPRREDPGASRGGYVRGGQRPGEGRPAPDMHSMHQQPYPSEYQRGQQAPPYMETPRGPQPSQPNMADMRRSGMPPEMPEPDRHDSGMKESPLGVVLIVLAVLCVLVAASLLTGLWDISNL